MIYPSEEIQKKYYFTKNGVVYNISSGNNKDGCGDIFTFPTVSELTKEAIEELGKDYTIEQLNEKTSNKIKEKLEPFLPKIIITYQRYYTNAQSEEKLDTKEYKKYLWLDFLIKDGDLFDGENEFKSCCNDDGKSYYNQFEDSIKEDIAKKCISISNATIDNLRRYYPYYVTFDENEDDTKIASIDGWKVEIQKIEGLSALLTKANISNIIQNYAEQKALEAANSVGSKVGKVYKSVTLS